MTREEKNMWAVIATLVGVTILLSVMLGTGKGL
jgi:hypothetical protein